MARAMNTAGGLLLLASALYSAGAAAYQVNINSGSRAVYLRVGTGVMVGGGGTYDGGGTPGNGGGISQVSVTVPVAAVGNGVNQAMTATGGIVSQWDGYSFCNAGQLYVGGFFRRSNGGGGGVTTATLSVNAPNDLTNAANDTIPISQISWTSSGNGDGAFQPIPTGTFVGGTQNLATFNRNVWNESCHSFSYGNDILAAAGTYTARVTYTLAVP